MNMNTDSDFDQVEGHVGTDKVYAHVQVHVRMSVSMVFLNFIDNLRD